MLNYFGYGSNMDIVSLRAKGVEPRASRQARLQGWRLAFNVAHYFTHEGGVGNIVRTDNPEDVVHGVLHCCSDEDLGKLDAVEAYGVGYDRVEVELLTEKGAETALAYIGMDGFIDDSCLPTRRYLNILIRGAEAAGLEPVYVDRLRAHPLHQRPVYPRFDFPSQPSVRYNAETLAQQRHLTALAGAVFDMRDARWQHEHLIGLFGGRDMTLWHLRRLDSSDGSESEQDLAGNRFTDEQRTYLNEYLHEYLREYRYAGRFEYDAIDKKSAEKGVTQ